MNKEIKITKQALVKFISANYENLTIAEMAQISKWSIYTVSSVCKELGVTPITIGGQKLKRIKQLSHLPLWEIAKAMNLHEERIRQYLKELGIAPIHSTQLVKEEVEIEKKPADYTELVDKGKYLGPIARAYQQREPLDIINNVLYR